MEKGHVHCSCGFVTIIIISMTTISIVIMTTISCHLSPSLAPQLQRVSDSLVAYLLGAGAIATAVQVPHRAVGAAVAAAAMEAAPSSISRTIM